MVLGMLPITDAKDRAKNYSTKGKLLQRGQPWPPPGLPSRHLLRKCEPPYGQRHGRLLRGHDFQKRGNDGAGVRSLIEEAYSSRLEPAPDSGKLVGLDIALLILEADDGPVAHPGRAPRFVHGPLQCDPGHSALDGQEHRARQNFPP